MKVMKGFFNQLLRIDLTHRKSTVEPIPESILRSYLGGKGLGSYLLLKENPPHIDPFSPQNRLIITLGPLADTPFFCSPCIRWRKETYEAEEAILKKVGKHSGALVIGPAGENLVKFAVIESERWRSLGRAGIGAVMGSKKLKGIVFHGRRGRTLPG